MRGVITGIVLTMTPRERIRWESLSGRIGADEAAQRILSERKLAFGEVVADGDDADSS